MFMLYARVFNLIGAVSLVALGSIALVQSAQAAQPADDYPLRPLRLVAPFAPGGGVDIVSRILATPLGESLGQQVVVDNRPGAGSLLGTEIVAHAQPDGYTLLVNTIALAFNAVLQPKLPFDTLRDLAPVTLVAQQPNIMVVHPSSPAKTLKEFAELARAQPGKLTYGSAGIASGTHLAAELLLGIELGLKMIHVPYKGTGPALTGVLGGEVTTFLSTFASALRHVKAGRLRALAVTSAKRSPATPDVPTVAEQGIAGFDYVTWYGLLTTGKTPRPIVERLHKTATKVVATPEVQKLLLVQGLEPMSTTPDEFAAYLKAEIEKWGKVVRAAGIKLH
jgi:tripartite-type tricarboxylate transporter receptor subunit TctC